MAGSGGPVAWARRYRAKATGYAARVMRIAPWPCVMRPGNARANIACGVAVRIARANFAGVMVLGCDVPIAPPG